MPADRPRRVARVVALRACPHCKQGYPRYRLLDLGYLHTHDGEVVGWCYNTGRAFARASHREVGR